MILLETDGDYSEVSYRAKIVGEKPVVVWKLGEWEGDIVNQLHGWFRGCAEAENIKNPRDLLAEIIR